MKTLTKSLALVAVAATMLSACSENETKPIQTENGLYSYTFELGDPETRSTFSETCIKWVSGDNIGVWSHASGGESVNQGSAVTIGTPCTINLYSTVALASGDKVFFSYPYRSDVNSNVPYGTVRLAIPTNQKNGDASSMPMVAEPFTATTATTAKTKTAAGKIYFSNLGSIIRFRIYDTEANSKMIKSVTFNADKAIAGFFEKDLSAINFSDKSTLAISGYTDKEITTTIPTPTAIGTTADATASVVGMVVAPGSYTGTILVTATDGTTYTITIPSSKPQKCDRNTVRTININLKNATSVSVTTPTLTQRVASTTESQIGVQWSTSNFSNAQADQEDTYTFSVYNDSACTDLRFTWTFKAGAGSSYTYKNKKGKTVTNAVSNIWYYGGIYYFPGVIVSGLAPSTTYYVKITDTTNSLSSTQSYTTSASKAFDVASIADGAAAVGQTILFEDFSQVFYGSDQVHGLSGYTSELRGTSTTMVVPEGANPYADNTTKKIYNVKVNYHSSLFGTFYNLVDNSTRLKKWAPYVENNQYFGLCIQAGQIIIGDYMSSGDIVTPPLSCLSGAAKLEVQFDAAPYVEGASLVDPLTAVVEVFKGTLTMTYNSTSTAAGTRWIDYSVATNKPTNTQIVTINSKNEFQHYTVTIDNVPAGARIGIGPKIADKKNGYHRMYLDNIQIKVVSYD